VELFPTVEAMAAADSAGGAAVAGSNTGYRLDVRVNRLEVRGSVIQDRIRDVLAAHGRMAVDPREVDSQADLYELGLTSHASVDVMLALEDAFDIEFPDEVLKKSTFASVRNIEQVVEGLAKSSA
jgi:acyl carrier protein